MEIEEDEDFAFFLENKTKTEPGTLKLDELIDLYVTPNDIDMAHQTIIQKRMAAVYAYMKQKEIFARFTLDESFVDDASHNRPRFEMSYEVAE